MVIRWKDDEGSYLVEAAAPSCCAKTEALIVVGLPLSLASSERVLVLEVSARHLGASPLPICDVHCQTMSPAKPHTPRKHATEKIILILLRRFSNESGMMNVVAHIMQIIESLGIVVAGLIHRANVPKMFVPRTKTEADSDRTA